MDNIASRSTFLYQELVDNIAQYDLGSFTDDHFNFGKINYMYVNKFCECRPDVISYKLYGTQNYWWFIMWFNGYCDIWNDLVEGQIIKYPSLQKVRDFLRMKLKKKNQVEAQIKKQF